MEMFPKVYNLRRPRPCGESRNNRKYGIIIITSKIIVIIKSVFILDYPCGDHQRWVVVGDKLGPAVVIRGYAYLWGYARASWGTKE